LFDKYRSFVYSFSEKNRVFGFCGSLGREQSRITVQDIIICYSCIYSPGLAEHYRSQVKNMIKQSDWKIKYEGSLLQYELADLTLTVLTATYSKYSCIHIILSYGKGEEDRYKRFFEIVSRLILDNEQNNVIFNRHSADDGFRKEFTVLKSEKEVVEVLSDSYNVVYTGAGVSLASDIETFVGNGSIGNDLFPLNEKFPARLLVWMIEKSYELIIRLSRFQSRFITATPNMAHYSLAEMEEQGIISYIITSNIDSLHQLAGSQNIIKSCDFARLLQSKRLHKKEFPDILFVIGVSQDEKGIISSLRSKGSHIVVVDTSPPLYLQSNDLFYEGPAEKILPVISQFFLNKPSRRYGGVCSISNLEQVIDELVLLAPMKSSIIHGERHWQCVAYIGLQLAKAVSSCDPLLVLIFSIIHDSMRLSDGSDRDHPRKACLLIEGMNHSQFSLSSHQMNILRKAVLYHSDGNISPDPTIGVCWDSDRLDLWRCGVIPEEEFLSTSAAKRLIQWSKTVHNTNHDWKSTLNEYRRLFPNCAT
jgi:uncharacterized protein